MKYKKSFLCFFIAAQVFCFLFYSCVDESPPLEDLFLEDENYNSKSDDYTVIRPETASKEIINSALRLRDEINLVMGSKIKFSDDFVSRGESVPSDTKEILVGKTNRAESQSSVFGLKANDYIIKQESSNGRIVIIGGSDDATYAAIEYFIKNFLDQTKGGFNIPQEGYIYRASYSLENLELDGSDIAEYYIEYDDTSPDNITAANTLRDFLRLKTGLTPETVKTGGSPPADLERRIIISSDKTFCQEDSIFILREKNNFVIGGGGPNGCFYSAACFIIEIISSGADIPENGLTVKIKDIKAPEPVNLYIAVNGSDSSGDGSAENPFATLLRARDEARNLKASLSPVVINIREGEYDMSKKGSVLVLKDEDSGTPLSPVTYQAYPGEKAVFTGGIKIASETAVPVTNHDILERVMDKYAAKKLMQIDLSGFLERAPDIMVPDSMGKIQSGNPEIYINNYPLAQSRWPNENQNSAYLRTINTKSLGENHQKSAFCFFYSDPENRTGKWSAEALRDLYIYGFISYDWSDGVYKVESIEKDRLGFVTTTGGSEWLPQSDTRFYFFNLPEEIDLPGESYLDPASCMLYFYPPCEMTKADIYVSKQENPLISLEGASYITIKNIEFVYSRNTAVSASKSNNIIIDGCEINHTSAEGINIYGTGCIIRNCHISGTMSGGIRMYGGERASLISSGNIIENNRLHDNSRIMKCYQPSIFCASTGTIIKNNKIYNSPHQLIEINGNDILITNNEIYNGVLESSDMGSVYYGRDPSVMGIEIKYNYFHDIGNSYGGIGQQSIFSDDGASMAYIYGNLFYRGTRTKEKGGTKNDSFVIKANGAQFGLVKNNIFVDSPAAALFGSWTMDFNASPKKEDRWLLWVWDLYPDYTHNIWSKLTEQVDFFSPLWRDKYKSTQWAPIWNYLNKEDYAQACTLSKSGNTKSLFELAYNKAPFNTNIFENNIGIKIDLKQNGQMFKENGTGTNNLHIEGKTLAGGEEIFKDWGGDFEFTPEALEFIRKNIPDFEELPLKNIGIHEYNDGISQKLPGGGEPTAKNMKITGILKTGNVLTADYLYSDPGNIPESVSKIIWYISDDGINFQNIPNGFGTEFWADGSCTGKYIKFEVTPCNRKNINGKTSVSEIVYIK